MKKFSLIAGLFLSFSFLYAGYITPQLSEKIASIRTGTVIRINIVMETQSDPSYLNSFIKGKTKIHRRIAVLSYLKNLSNSSQGDLLTWLKSEESKGKVSGITSLWIVNAISCEVTTDLIRGNLQKSCKLLQEMI
ncbi:MAG TPA: hypothetical protein EYP60_08665 [bacterium (Candidatus Stahlbacteria)]|nr:hypothetical protein [Candidatus Stahlbacteria bacterium]